MGAELAAANQFLSSHARHGGAGAGGARALSEALQVRDGYELALTAALGGRLDAALVRDLSGATALLDGAGPDGASALLAGAAADDSRAARRRAVGWMTIPRRPPVRRAGAGRGQADRAGQRIGRGA